MNEMKQLNPNTFPLGTVIKARLPICMHYDYAIIVDYSYDFLFIEIEWLNCNETIWLQNNIELFQNTSINEIMISNKQNSDRINIENLSIDANILKKFMSLNENRIKNQNKSENEKSINTLSKFLI